MTSELDTSRSDVQKVLRPLRQALLRTRDALLPRHIHGSAVRGLISHPRGVPRTVRFSMREALRDRVEGGLGVLGVGHALARRIQLGGAIIVMYHSVVDDETARFVDPANAVTVDTFERHIHFLAHERRVVSMDALLDEVEAGRTPEAGTVVITFDDGYRDGLTHAAPILARYGLPATLYLATGYLDRGENQWIDEIYTAFSRRTRDGFEMDGDGYDLSVPHSRDRAYHRLAGRLLKADLAQRRRLLERVKAQLQPAGSAPRLTLSWEEVRELLRVAPSLEIGVHTVDHLDLTRLSPEAAEAEIQASMERVHGALGVRPRHMTYPYGRWNETVHRIASRSGLRSCCATTPAARVTAKADPFRLPRIEAPSELELLAHRTSGAYPDPVSRVLGSRVGSSPRS